MTKFLAGTLSGLLFVTNSVLAGSLETNIWKERQKKQVAALPTEMIGGSLENSQSLLRQFPSLGKALDTVSNSQSNFSKLKLPPSVAPYLQSIPLNSGTVKDLYLSEGGADNNPLVILIQDVHLNQEAQRNIANILLALNDQASALHSQQPMLVGVEGAFGPFDFARFRAFEDKGLIKAVADFFLKENKFAAPSYVGITAATPATSFYGIDDLEHYKANVEAYRSSQLSKKSIAAELEKEKQALAEGKRKVLNLELMKFDAKRSSYLNGSNGIGEYVVYLARTAESLGKSDDGQELVLEQFLSAYQLETSLDFQQVERERARIVEKLAAKLTKDDLNQLLAQGLAYRMGKTSFAGYYKAIKDLIDRHHISLASALAFDQYIRYVLLADGIQAEPLLAAVQRLEQNVMSGLVRTLEEKNLMEHSRRLYLMGKLIEFALTPEEWTEYKSVIPAKAGMKPFEEFYQQADIRSDRMIANLISQQSSKNPVSALVVGGFHTPQLTHLLKEKGISYAVVQPKITKVDGVSGTEYLSIFTREKTPLDKLFEGEKLFLAPYAVEAGNDVAAHEVGDEFQAAVFGEAANKKAGDFVCPKGDRFSWRVGGNPTSAREQGDDVIEPEGKPPIVLFVPRLSLPQKLARIFKNIVARVYPSSGRVILLNPEKRPELAKIVGKLTGIPPYLENYLQTPHYHQKWHVEGGPDATLADHLEAILRANNERLKTDTGDSDENQRVRAMVNALKAKYTQSATLKSFGGLQTVLEIFVLLHDIGKQETERPSDSTPNSHAFDRHENRSWEISEENPGIHYAGRSIPVFLKFIIREHMIAVHPNTTVDFAALKSLYPQNAEIPFDQAVELLIITTTSDLMGSHQSEGMYGSLEPVLKFEREFREFQKLSKVVQSKTQGLTLKWIPENFQDNFQFIKIITAVRNSLLGPKRDLPVERQAIDAVRDILNLPDLALILARLSNLRTEIARYPILKGSIPLNDPALNKINAEVRQIISDLAVINKGLLKKGLLIIPDTKDRGDGVPLFSISLASVRCIIEGLSLKGVDVPVFFIRPLTEHDQDAGQMVIGWDFVSVKTEEGGRNGRQFTLEEIISSAVHEAAYKMHEVLVGKENFAGLPDSEKEIIAVLARIQYFEPKNKIHDLLHIVDLWMTNKISIEDEPHVVAAVAILDGLFRVAYKNNLYRTSEEAAFAREYIETTINLDNKNVQAVSNWAQHTRDWQLTNGMVDMLLKLDDATLGTLAHRFLVESQSIPDDALRAWSAQMPSFIALIKANFSGRHEPSQGDKRSMSINWAWLDAFEWLGVLMSAPFVFSMMPWETGMPPLTAGEISFELRPTEVAALRRQATDIAAILPSSRYEQALVGELLPKLITDIQNKMEGFVDQARRRGTSVTAEQLADVLKTLLRAVAGDAGNKSPLIASFKIRVENRKVFMGGVEILRVDERLHWNVTRLAYAIKRITGRKDALMEGETVSELQAILAENESAPRRLTQWIKNRLEFFITVQKPDAQRAEVTAQLKVLLEVIFEIAGATPDEAKQKVGEL